MLVMVLYQFLIHSTTITTTTTTIITTIIMNPIHLILQFQLANFQN